MAVNEKLAQAYAALIRAGKRTLEDVHPDELRQRVAEILAEGSVENGA